MGKSIKDYLYLYLGAEGLEVLSPNPDDNEPSFKKAYLMGITAVSEACVEVQFHNGIHADEEESYLGYDEVKPILRPLSGMTEEENAEAKQFYRSNKWGEQTLESMAAISAYLLSKHFDLFGLIEANLAIDKTTLK
jgi:hypothetical protein